jgi:hypothetical protein
MCSLPIGEAGAPAAPPRATPRQAARERGRLSVSGSSRGIQVVFEPLDFLAQGVSFASVSIARFARAVLVATEPFDFVLLPRDFALLPFQFGDQLLARRRAPPRSHASVIASCEIKYKRKLMSSRPLSPSRTSSTR